MGRKGSRVHTRPRTPTDEREGHADVLHPPRKRPQGDRLRHGDGADSGPRHLANAAGIPVFFVPNLAVGKIETGAYLDTETDLAPDFEWVPPSGQADAFARLEPARMAEIIASNLLPS